MVNVVYATRQKRRLQFQFLPKNQTPLRSVKQLPKKAPDVKELPETLAIAGNMNSINIMECELGMKFNRLSQLPL